MRKNCFKLHSMNFLWRSKHAYIYIKSDGSLFVIIIESKYTSTIMYNSTKGSIYVDNHIFSEHCSTWVRNGEFTSIDKHIFQNIWWHWCRGAMWRLRAVKNLYRSAVKLVESKFTLKESILMPIDFKTLE